MNYDLPNQDNAFKSLQTSQVLAEMGKIEECLPMVDLVQQWEARWIRLKCWLEMYGEQFKEL